VKWTLAWLDDANLRNVGWIDYDFIDGWDETKALGRAALLFSEGNFLEVFPDEATVHITFIGGD